MARKLYKTTFKAIILSEEPIDEDAPLWGIIRDCDVGDLVLHSVESNVKLVSVNKMKDLLEEAGSEPEFFQLGPKEEQ